MAEDKMKKEQKHKEKETPEVTSENNGKDWVEDKNADHSAESEEEKGKKSKKDKKENKVSELEDRLGELTDKHLRLQAEFDNFRKRTLKEKADLIKSGGESVLIGILPIVDDFERALQSLKDIPEDDPGKIGTLLIYSKLRELLKQNNVKEIEALEHDFDVDHHEALTKIPAPEEKLKGKVVDVIQKGYVLNDKVIRYAKVVVGE
jgi:molecular chaperone GrpE